LWRPHDPLFNRTEPSNFLVGRLLASGAFHDLAAANESAAGRQEAFLLVLCHAFLRQRLHPMAVAHWRRHKADTPSLVSLGRVLADVVARLSLLLSPVRELFSGHCSKMQSPSSRF
jgi:hypothetical protein